MSAPELAEVTAARAYLADYRRQVREDYGRGPLPWQELAMRLAQHLGYVLDALSAQMPRPRADGSVGATCVLLDGSAMLSPADLLAVLGALRVAAEAGDTADRYAYLACARALGDDR